jgi:GNAT superfamily N-acetyltransferase
MNLRDPQPIRRRFAARRRCFGLRVADQIVAYGWATRGVEHVGELERDFRLRADEIYVWDCATLPAWRGQRCYTTLLNDMLHQFRQEGLPRCWVGASRHNRPSIQGIVHAGFEHVLDVLYRRWGPVTLLQFAEAPSASRTQLDAAYRILLTRHERRWGRVAFGVYRRAP